MRSPVNKEEENVYTSLTEAYLGKREKAYKEEFRVYRLFLWLAVLFCMACLFLCWYGFSTFMEQNRDLNYYISHETVLSEHREQREIKKDQRDSLAWARHIQQMDRYDTLPDYKDK